MDVTWKWVPPSITSQVRSHHPTTTPTSLHFLQLHPLGSSLQLHFFLTLSLRLLPSQSTDSSSSYSTSSPSPEGLLEVSLLWHGVLVVSRRKLQGGRFMRVGSWRVRVLAPPCSLSASSWQPRPPELSFKKFHLLILFHSLLVLLLWSCFSIVSMDPGSVPLDWKPMVNEEKGDIDLLLGSKHTAGFKTY